MKKNYLPPFISFIPKKLMHRNTSNNESIQTKKQQLYCLYECQNICYPTQIIEKGTLLIQNGKVIRKLQHFQNTIIKS
jgi:hypothetical protein